MDPEQQDRETENSQWNYLDGTPARLNEDVGRGGGLLVSLSFDLLNSIVDPELIFTGANGC